MPRSSRLSNPYNTSGKLPDLPFPPIDPAHWEEGKNILGQWMAVMRSHYGAPEPGLIKLKAKLQDYYKRNLNVFFIYTSLTHICDHHKASTSLAGIPLVKFKGIHPITDKLAGTEKKRFDVRNKKRTEAFKIIKEQCQNHGLDIAPLLQLEEQLNKLERIPVIKAVQKICNLDSYRRHIDAPRGKKFINPLLVNGVRSLVDYFSSLESRRRYKWAIPEVAVLMKFIGVPISEKTIERYCALAEPLPRLPLPQSTSNQDPKL